MDTSSRKENNIEKYRVDGMSLKRKTDKIAAAVHMVTDLIEDNEPIRWKLRQIAVELASDAHTLIHASAKDRVFIFSDFELLATEMMSFISIARSARMISEMNAEILLRELTGNTERMRTWTETGLYEVEGEISVGKSAVSFTLNENHFKAEPSLSFLQNSQVSETDTSTQDKGHHIKQSVVQVQKKQEAADSRKFDFAMKLNRRNAILKIIKDKKEVTIKDISLMISDCSEKTIQRELINLVSEGVLKRVGEKRWSKYMLAER